MRNFKLCTNNMERCLLFRGTLREGFHCNVLVKLRVSSLTRDGDKILVQ